MKSRKAGHLDLFMRSSLLMASGRTFDVVTQAENIEHFGPMRTDLYRSSCGHYIAELVDAFAPERLANLALYELMLATLRRLSGTDNLELSVRRFELLTLGLAGYQPQLFHCLDCAQAIQPRVNFFSAQLGGILCPRCGSTNRAATSISVNALKVLRHLQTGEPTILGIRELDPGIAREIERHLQESIAYRLEKRPLSLRFLERLRVEGVGANGH
jgi:DNA repair protein RecO (recombination protein O)